MGYKKIIKIPKSILKKQGWAIAENKEGFFVYDKNEKRAKKIVKQYMNK